VKGRANRSFLALIVACVVAGLVVGMAACVLVSLLAWRVSTEGLDALTADGRDLRPALLFLLAVSAGTVLAAWSLRTQVVSSLRLGRRIRELGLPLTPELVELGRRTRLEGRLRLVDAPEPFSFAYGALYPRVAVSRGLCEVATPEELEAVLVHERFHVRNADPLKVVVARALPPLFFYLPILRALYTGYLVERELAADRRALRACGRRPLAGALLKAVGGPGWGELRVAAAIGGPELLGVRVAQLEAGKPPAVRTPWLTAAVSALAAAVLTAGFGLAVVEAGGPLAVLEATGHGGDPGAFDAALALAGAVPWLAAVVCGWHWLRRLTRDS
jgi:Zn-dependent protease with chaperone function